MNKRLRVAARPPLALRIRSGKRKPRLQEEAAVGVQLKPRCSSSRLIEMLGRLNSSEETLLNRDGGGRSGKHLPRAVSPERPSGGHVLTT